VLRTDMGGSQPAIGYVISEYPAVSHTFVRREIAALRERGLRVLPFSIRASRRLVSAADLEEASTTIYLRPVSPLGLARCHLAALRYSFTGYFRTLSFALRRGEMSPRATLWQLFYFGEAIVLWWHARQENVKHLHSHFANSGADVGRLAAVFSKSGGAPCDWSFTMHGSAEFLDLRRFRLARKVEDASFVACISDYCRSQLMWLVDPRQWDKLVVVRCGIAFSPTSALRRPRDGVLTRLNVVTVGRLIPLKGHALLIDALHRIRQYGIASSLRIIGSGPLEARLRELALQHVNSVDVQFLGALGEEEIKRQYEWADVFCLPSMMEGLPVVLMEAMAHGLPVIATDITGLRELIDDDQTGLLVRPGRADLIADALERMAREPGTRSRTAFRGYQKVRTEFDVRASAAQLEELFQTKVGLNPAKTSSAAA
jgi:colanic acid/amylovoran biosynthesis glycosyltransferase